MVDNQGNGSRFSQILPEKIENLGRFVIVMMMITLLVAIAACAPTQPQQITVVETVVVEKEVEKVVEKQVTVEVETVVEVEKEVAKEVLVEVQGAIPYPESIPLNINETTEVTRLPIEEMVAYRALPEYHEPEWITELVEAGELPPVEERLPKEPQVILTAGMADGIGQYGDSWRDFSACPTAGWNNGAGVTAGWFGIESSSFASLVDTGPLFRANQDIEPFPELAKSWEWSADGKQLTMHLIEEAKWSDGEPFTSEDVLFVWEDLILDPNVNSWQGASNWEFDGQLTQLEAVDDYTILWTFPVEKPVHKFYSMDELDFDIHPAHILKPLHPKYNPDTDYVAFENALPPDKVPPVVMGPWVAVEYKTDELVVLRRNPYYWKVDETGQQLPYIDEIVFQKGPSGVGRSLCTLAGGCDHSNLENPAGEFTEALKREQEPDAQFDINWGPELLGFHLVINQSVDLGVKDERDAALRQLFRDLRFRRALSQAIDRDGVAQSIMRGPFVRAWAGGLYPGAPEFEPESVVYYPYSPDSAEALLAEIGFEDTDADGILNWTEGPLEGENLSILMTANEDQQEAVNIGQALVTLFGQVGIQINFRPVTSAARGDIEQSGEWETHVWRGGQNFALPFTRCSEMAPLTRESPAWHREGSQPRELRPFETELIEIIQEYCPTQDPAKRKELINQYNHIYTENVYSVGVVVSRYGLALAKRFRNVAPGSPVFLYNWFEWAGRYEQVWSDPAEQREQVRPNVIPVYSQ